MQTKYKLGFKYNNNNNNNNNDRRDKAFVILIDEKRVNPYSCKNMKREQMKKKKRKIQICGGGGVWCVNA